MIDKNRQNQSEGHRQQSGDGVGEQAGINLPGQLLGFVRGRVLRYVADNRRANSEVKQPVVAGDRKNQDPDAKRRVPQPVDDKWG